MDIQKLSRNTKIKKILKYQLGYQKLINLSYNTPIQLSKFRKKH